MKRLSKTALLAGGMTAALLISAPMAMAAPQTHDSHTQTFRHDRSYNDGSGYRDGNYKNKDRNARDERRNEQRDGRHRAHFAENGRRIFFVRYEHARYGERFHRPPMRAEYAGRPTHAGMRWQAGEWRWHNNHRVWVAGMWLIAAHAMTH